MPTASALADILMRENDESTDNSELKDTFISWISDAIDEVSYAYDWKENKVIFPFSTTALQSTDVMHASLSDIRSIRFVDTDEEIHYKDDPRLFMNGADLEETGKPRDWFFDSQDDDPATAISAQAVIKIRWHPIPDAIYPLTISAQKHPLVAEITSGANIPLRQEMILAVKDRVRAYSLANDKDYEGSNSYLQLFYNRLNEMIGRESLKPSGRQMRMQVTDIVPSTSNRGPFFDPSHYSNS